MSKKSKTAEFKKATAQAKDLLTFLETLEKDYSTLLPKVDDLKKLEIMNKELRNANAKMKADLDLVSTELEKVSKEFDHLKKDRDAKIDMREILALSMTLLTEVFGAQPHSKILFLLHGEKDAWSRDDLVKSSGISAAAIRKALADLAAAKLAKYDVETGMVELLKRLY